MTRARRYIIKMLRDYQVSFPVARGRQILDCLFVDQLENYIINYNKPKNIKPTLGSDGHCHKCGDVGCEYCMAE